MSFEAGLAAFKQDNFEVAIEQLLLYCEKCDAAQKVTSKRYLQAHKGLVKSYRKLGQLDQAIAHCQQLTNSPNADLILWVEKTLPKLTAAAQKEAPHPHLSSSAVVSEPVVEDAIAEPVAEPIAEPEPAPPVEVTPPAEPEFQLPEDKMVMLQEGLQAFKRMKCDRAVILLEAYLQDCPNRKSRHYMQAEMTLIKAYRESRQIHKAIARCERLTHSDNFPLKSFAVKTLPQLQDAIGSAVDAPAAPKQDTLNQPGTELNPAAMSLASSVMTKTRPTPQRQHKRPAHKRPSSFSFDASSRDTPQPVGGKLTPIDEPIDDPMADSPHHEMSPDPVPPQPTPSQATPQSQAYSPSPSPTPSESAASPSALNQANWHSVPEPASPKSRKHSTAHQGIGMLGGAFLGTVGTVLGRRLMRRGIGLALGLVFFVFRGCFGLDSDMSPLQKAVLEGNVASVEKLIDKGKSLETTDDSGNTAIFWALFADECSEASCSISVQQQQIVDLLLANGANVKVANEWQETPLHLAASIDGSADILRALLDKGANINALDTDQSTPLHWAANYGITENIELLLNRGADINVKDVYGYTPLDSAEFAGSASAVQLLKSRGAVAGN